MVVFLDRANEAVEADVKNLIHLAEIAGHFIRQLARCATLLRCLSRHLQPVFVRAGLKAHVPPQPALKAGDHVGGDRFVGVADMRAAIGVIDRGGEIKGVSHRRAR
jgi:hypothetical protein